MVVYRRRAASAHDSASWLAGSKHADSRRGLFRAPRAWDDQPSLRVCPCELGLWLTASPPLGWLADACDRDRRAPPAAVTLAVPAAPARVSRPRPARPVPAVSGAMARCSQGRFFFPHPPDHRPSSDRPRQAAPRPMRERRSLPPFGRAGIAVDAVPFPLGSGLFPCFLPAGRREGGRWAGNPPLGRPATFTPKRAGIHSPQAVGARGAGAPGGWAERRGAPRT